MDPVELEYIGEKEEIGVIPNFNFDPIHLISGTIGKSLINSIKINHKLILFRSIPSWSSSAHSTMARRSFKEATKVPNSTSFMDG